jgi:hypothetical protein
MVDLAVKINNRIQEMLGSNLSVNTGYSDRRFKQLYSVLPEKLQDIIRLGQGRFFSKYSSKLAFICRHNILPY